MKGTSLAVLLACLNDCSALQFSQVTTRPKGTSCELSATSNSIILKHTNRYKDEKLTRLGITGNDLSVILKETFLYLCSGENSRFIDKKEISVNVKAGDVLLVGHNDSFKWFESFIAQKGRPPNDEIGNVENWIKEKKRIKSSQLPKIYGVIIEEDSSTEDSSTDDSSAEDSSTGSISTKDKSISEIQEERFKPTKKILPGLVSPPSADTTSINSEDGSNMPPNNAISIKVPALESDIDIDLNREIEIFSEPSPTLNDNLKEAQYSIKETGDTVLDLVLNGEFEPSECASVEPMEVPNATDGQVEENTCDLSVIENIEIQLSESSISNMPNENAADARETETETKTDAEAKAKAIPLSESEPGPEAESESETKTEVIPLLESEPEPDTEPEAEAEPEADTEPEAEPEADTESETKTEAIPLFESELEPEIMPRIESKPESEPEAKAEPEVEIKTAVEAILLPEIMPLPKIIPSPEIIPSLEIIRSPEIEITNASGVEIEKLFESGSANDDDSSENNMRGQQLVDEASSPVSNLPSMEEPKLAKEEKRIEKWIFISKTRTIPTSNRDLGEKSGQLMPKPKPKPLVDNNENSSYKWVKNYETGGWEEKYYEEAEKVDSPVVKNTEPRSRPEADPEPQPQADPESQPEAGPESQFDHESESDPEPQPDHESESESQPKNIEASSQIEVPQGKAQCLISSVFSGIKTGFECTKNCAIFVFGPLVHAYKDTPWDESTD